MTATAWGFMLAVWAVIIGATAYCFVKLLSSGRRLDGDDEETFPPAEPQAGPGTAFRDQGRGG
jgi:hypothetical protein